MKNRNWFWGIFFIVAAVFVIASQIGTFEGISFFSIVSTVALVALAVHSLFKLNYFGIFVPVAFLYMIYWKPFALLFISPWILILAAVLISIGLSILFHRHPKIIKSSCGGSDHFNQTAENIDDNNPYAKVSFGTSIKYLHSDSLKSGQFNVSFGSLEVFFDQAQVSPEGAEIYVECSFGELKLYIPKEWKVTDKIHSSLGGVQNDIRIAKPAEDAPQITLVGNVQLGNIEITYT